MRDAMILVCGMALVGCAGSREAPPRSVTTTGPLALPAPATRAVAFAPPLATPLPGDPDERAIFELSRASALFETFIAKAGDDPRFADAVRRSKERMADIDRTIEFLKAGLRERKGG